MFNATCTVALINNNIYCSFMYSLKKPLMDIMDSSLKQHGDTKASALFVIQNRYYSKWLESLINYSRMGAVTTEILKNFISY